MAGTSQAPIKVAPEIKEQIRIAAAVLHRSQSDFVGAAVCEYVQRHADEFSRGLAAAHQALALGKDATLAYVTGASVEDVRRVTGRDEASTH